MVKTKICTKCGQLFDISKFNRAKAGRYERRGDCKKCQGIDGKIYREANFGQRRLYFDDYVATHKEERRISDQNWYKKNRSYVLTRQKKYATENREKIHVYIVKYRKEHVEDYRVRVAQRRIRLANNGGSFTKEEWMELKERCDNTCLCCGRKEPEIKLTLDHIIPVIKGGSGDIENIQPLCPKCNIEKYTKTIDYRSKIKKPNLGYNALDRHKEMILNASY